MHAESKGRKRSGVKSNLKEVTLEMYKRFRETVELIPGNKICAKCILKANEQPNDSDNEIEEMETPEIYSEDALDIANKSLSILDCSPLKKVRADKVISESKRKIEAATSKLANVISAALVESLRIS